MERTNMDSTSAWAYTSRGCCPILCLALLLGGRAAAAEASDFVASQLGDAAVTNVLILTEELAAQGQAILGRRYAASRLTYWSAGGKRLWLLDGRGLSGRFTAGFVVEDGSLVHSEVLQYVGAQGRAITGKPFLRQFRGVRLRRGGNGLDRQVEAVSGATISATAFTNLARLVLVLDAAAGKPAAAAEAGAG